MSPKIFFFFPLLLFPLPVQVMAISCIDLDFGLFLLCIFRNYFYLLAFFFPPCLTYYDFSCSSSLPLNHFPSTPYFYYIVFFLVFFFFFPFFPHPFTPFFILYSYLSFSLFLAAFVLFSSWFHRLYSLTFHFIPFL